MADKEYIERGALVKRLWASPLFDNITKNGLLIKAGVIDLVKRQPATDVVEVRQREWIKVADLCGIEVLKCSVCGMEHPRKATAFCCDCGAKMDRKGEGG